MTKKSAPIVELQASQLELVVSEKTIGSLTTNAKQIRELVEKALPMYDISNYSTDDLAKAKSDKTLLNKAAKSLNDKRIQFEKEFMAPFSEFKEVVNDTVSLIKEAVGKIDTVIKADDERCKAEKRKEIERIGKELGVEAAGINLQKIWNAKWLNKSTSLKAVEKDITEKMNTINADLETLKSFAEDYDVLVVRYKENLNLQETVRYANQLKEMREKSDAKECPKEEVTTEVESKKPEEPAEKHQEQKSSHHGIDNFAADAADAFADFLGQSAGKPLTEYKHYEVTATCEQLAALELYMREQGIMFNSID